jgi:hypothetical protein
MNLPTKDRLRVEPSDLLIVAAGAGVVALRRIIAGPKARHPTRPVLRDRLHG